LREPALVARFGKVLLDNHGKSLGDEGFFFTLFCLVSFFRFEHSLIDRF